MYTVLSAPQSAPDGEVFVDVRYLDGGEGRRVFKADAEVPHVRPEQ